MTATDTIKTILHRDHAGAYAFDTPLVVEITAPGFKHTLHITRLYIQYHILFFESDCGNPYELQEHPQREQITTALLNFFRRKMPVSI